MTVAGSRLDRPAARAVAAALAVAATGAVAWLLYVDNRQDPAIAACIAKHSAAITAARDKGALPPNVAARFLAHVAQSCTADAEGGGSAPGAPPR